jgi:3-oxoacyl-ACP reductase-like protein
MPATDAERLALHRRLEAVLGPNEAATLMTAVPPVGWSDLVTKDVLRSEMSLLRGEMANMESGLRSDMADLRSEIGAVRAEMAAEFGSVRSEIGSVRADSASQTRMLMLTMVVLVVAMVGTVFGALALVR